MPAPQLRAIEVPVGLLEARQDNPRRTHVGGDKTRLAELAASIREHGVIEPLIVQQLAHSRFRIVCGERRWRAAQLAELELVPVIVRELGPAQAFVFALVENIQRSTLDPLDEAQALARMVDELGYTQKEAAATIGRSTAWVSKKLLLLTLPKSTQRLVSGGSISQSTALGYEAAPPADVFGADEQLQGAWRKLRAEVLEWGDQRMVRALREFARAYAHSEQLRRGKTNGHVPAGRLK